MLSMGELDTLESQRPASEGGACLTTTSSRFCTHSFWERWCYHTVPPQTIIAP